ncbi:hypothetical protein [Endozoicomonas atrinae]|uniref:hypothetical protein n=1 Tax=Endozoicomonas atrinae TaxID=1333660 RepID=UPI003AFF90A9
MVNLPEGITPTSKILHIVHKSKDAFEIFYDEEDSSGDVSFTQIEESFSKIVEDYKYVMFTSIENRQHSVECLETGKTWEGISTEEAEALLKLRNSRR